MVLWRRTKLVVQHPGTVPYKGRGRKPYPKRVVDSKLRYAQLIKQREGYKVVKTSTRIILGDELEILDMFDASSFSSGV